MEIHSLLPLLKGWTWDAKVEVKNETIPAGKSVTKAHILYPGWLWTAGFSASSPLATLNMIYDEYLSTEITPADLVALGLTIPNATGSFCPVYTSGPPPIYVLAMMPTIPLPFNKKVDTIIKNPTGADITLYYYAHMLVKIEDEVAFRKSLKELGIASVPLLPVR